MKYILLALLLASVWGYAAYDAQQEWAIKQAQQSKINLAVSGFKKSYERFQPNQNLWLERFPLLPKNMDVFGLYAKLAVNQAGLSGQPDLLRMIANETVVVNGQALGLLKLCLATRNDALVLHAPTLTQALAGLRQMTARPNLSFDNVAIKPSTHSKTPQLDIYLTNMCLYYREPMGRKS